MNPSLSDYEIFSASDVPLTTLLSQYRAPTIQVIKGMPPPPNAQCDRQLNQYTHRFNGYEAVKRSKEWLFATEAAQQNTPDPSALSISKRSWEKAMQKWRADLRTSMRHECVHCEMHGCCMTYLHEDDMNL